MAKGDYVSAKRWYWTELPRLGGASGGLAGKVFRNIDALTAEDLLAREVIQNSWDASRKLNQTRAKNAQVPFKMEFKFQKISGKAKKEFLESTGIKEIFEQSKLMKKKEAERAKKAFDAIFNSENLEILVCSDFGAHGLYGDISLSSKSILFRALYMFGDTGKDEDVDSGGSYGFGKSAFIRGSSIQTVFAYSSFKPFEKDKVTRRLVGATYWGSHITPDSRTLEGRAILGDPNFPEPGQPFEDKDADAMAKNLGLKTRNADNEENLGTSLLLIQPQVTPDKLLASIEKWWWPAIVDSDMEITVVDTNGKVHHPRPKSNPFVAPYLRPYEIIRDRSKISSVLNESLISSGWQSVAGIDVGKAVLRVATEEEIDAEPEGDGGRFPKIALMRIPKMIIEYKTYTKRRLPVRGVFLASQKADVHLKNTEPAQHSHWDTKPDPEIPEDSTAIAAGVESKLSNGLSKFIEEVSPPAPNERETLNVYSELLRNFLSGKREGVNPPPPPKSVAPIEIQFSKSPVTKAYKDQIFIEAEFKVSVSPKSEKNVYEVKITSDFQILEDESETGEQWPCHVDLVKAHKDFKVVSTNEIEGKLKKGETVIVRIKSDLYQAQWTSRLKPVVEILSNNAEQVV